MSSLIFNLRALNVWPSRRGKVSTHYKIDQLPPYNRNVAQGEKHVHQLHFRDISTAAFLDAVFLCQTLRALKCPNFKLQKPFFSDSTSDRYHTILKRFGLGRQFQAGNKHTPTIPQRQNALQVPWMRWVQRTGVTNSWGDQNLQREADLPKPWCHGTWAANTLLAAVCAETHLYCNKASFSSVALRTAKTSLWYIFLFSSKRVNIIIITS